MTQKVNPSPVRPAEAFKTAGAIAYGGHGDSGFIIDGANPTDISTQDGGIDETQLNAFAETSSASSLDVTIDPGEAFVFGSWVAIDTSTTVSLAASTAGQTVYVGWNKNSSNGVIIGTSSAFSSSSGDTDKKIPLFDFDTDGSGVTSVVDRRSFDQISADSIEQGSGSGLDADLLDGSDASELGPDVSNNGTKVTTNSSDIDFSSDITASDDADGTATVSLTNNSLTVAGNVVSLGGSTAVSTVDLSGDTDGLTEGTANLFYTDERAQDDVGGILGANFTYDDAGNSISLTNDSVTVAGNEVSLGGSTAVSTGDLSGDTDGLTEGTANLFYTDERAQDGVGSILGANFTYDDVGNSISLTSDSVTISTGDGLKNGGTVSLGGTTTLDVEPADFAGGFLSDDGADNLAVDIGRGLENDGTGSIQFDEDTGYTFTGAQTFNGGVTLGSNINASNNTITNLPEPTASDEASTKSYVDGVAQGLNLKDSVAVSNHDQQIDLTSTTDPNPIDGYTLSDGERILLKHQNDATTNGIYVATVATDPSTWVRAPDADEDAEVTEGSFTFIENGDTHGDTAYIITTPDPITLGTTEIEWSQFASAGTITAGDGLAKSGSSFSVTSSDLTGAFLSADENNNLQANIGRGLESDGTDAIQFDEDTGYTFTTAQTFSAGIDTQGDITDGPQAIWDASLGEIPDGAMGSIANTTLTNSSVTVAGNAVSLGGSTTVNHNDLSTISADDHHNQITFSNGGTAVLTQPTDVNAGSNTTISDDADGTITVSSTDTNTTDHGALTGLGDDDHTQYLLTDGTRSMSGSLNLGGDLIATNGEIVWDESATEIPDSALGSIANSTLTNSSVTVAGNAISLGGSSAINTTDLSGDTDGLTEGSANLFYTDERAQDGVGSILGANFTYDDAGNSITLSSDSVTVAGNTVALGGSSTPDASDFSGSAGTAGQYLKTDGTTASWSDIVSDVTIEDSGLAVLSTNNINFGSNLSVTDDTDGTVTVASSDSDSLSGLTIDINKNWSGYNITNVGTLGASDVDASSELGSPVYTDVASLPTADQGAIAYVQSEGTIYVQKD